MNVAAGSNGRDVCTVLPLRFVALIAVLLCGTQAAGSSALRWTASFTALGAIILARQFRAILLLALACGAAASFIDVRLSSIGNPRLVHERVLIIERTPFGSADRLRMRRSAGPDLEAWTAGAKRSTFSHRLACAAGPGMYAIVSGIAVPYEGVRNPGGFSSADAARERGVGGHLRGLVCERTEPVDVFSAAAWPARFRAWSAAQLKQRLSADAAAICAGVLLGARDELAEPVRADFVATGTVHVLVTAGLHIGIVGVALVAFFRRLGGGRATGAIIAGVVLCSYAALSGWHLPARRAAITASVALLATICGTAVRGSTAFLLAAGIIIILDPTCPGRLPFWLSFCCVGSIMLFTGPLARRMTAVPKPLAYAVAAGIAAQIGTWPLLAFGMHAFGVYAVPANILIVPLTGLLLLASAALLATAGISAVLPSASAVAALQALRALCNGVDHTLTLLCGTLTSLMATTAHVFAALPGGALIVADPPLIIVLAYYVLCILAIAVVKASHAYLDIFLRLRILYFCATRAMRIRMAAALLLAAQIIVAAGAFAPPPFRQTNITMLDVGQGDGYVVQSKSGHTVVIDTGGKIAINDDGAQIPDDGAAPAKTAAQRAGEAVLMPYLAHARIHAIDILILSHPHADHTGAAAEILRKYPVGLFVIGTPHTDDRGQSDAVQVAAAHQVPTYSAQRGEHLAFDGGTLEILAPFPHDAIDNDASDASASADDTHFMTSAEVNEHSLVFRLRVDGLSILCMGDAGIPTERRLLARPQELTADILKIGHHGSDGATSSEFLHAVQPRVALISVGRFNVFGHPAPKLLERLAPANAAVYRTDQCGAISITSNGGGPLDVQTILPCSPAK